MDWPRAKSMKQFIYLAKSQDIWRLYVDGFKDEKHMHSTIELWNKSNHSIKYRYVPISCVRRVMGYKIADDLINYRICAITWKGKEPDG